MNKKGRIRMKKWWFSILCYVCAIAITLFIVVGNFTIGNIDDYINILLILSSLSPILLLIIIGVANQPRKDK